MAFCYSFGRNTSCAFTTFGVVATTSAELVVGAATSGDSSTDFSHWALSLLAWLCSGTLSESAGPDSRKPKVKSGNNLWQHLRTSLSRRPPKSAIRSEERRVGKECRSRWSPYH